MTKLFKIFTFILSFVAAFAAYAAQADAAVTFSDKASNNEYGTSLKVHWDLQPSPGITYKVIYSTVPGGIQYIKDAGIDVDEKVITGLISNTSYIFTIQANGSPLPGYENVPVTTLAMELLEEKFDPSEEEFVWLDTEPYKASKYKIEYSVNPNMSGAVIADDLIYSVHAPSNLTPNTMYYYKVGAKNSAGEVNYKKNENGDDIVFSTMTLPAPPENPRFEPVGNTVFASSVTVKWTNAEPLSARGSRLYLEASKYSDFSSGIIRSEMIETSKSSSTLSGLAPNTTYYFRLSAENALGATSHSVIISTMTLAPQIFTDPSVLTLSATQDTIKADFVPLPTEDCAGYRLEVSTDSFFLEAVKSDSGGPGIDLLMITNLNYTTRYNVRMITKNSAGAENITDLGSIETLTVGAPQNISFKEVFQSSATLRFDRIRPAPQGYVVGLYHGDNSMVFISSAPMQPQDNKEEQTFTFTGLEPNTLYSAKVSAQYGAEYEDSASIDRPRWTLPATVPTPTVGEVHASSFTINYSSFTNAQAANFRLNIYKDQNFSADPVVSLFERPDEGQITAGSTFDNTIEPNTMYYVRGAMVNAEAEGIFVKVDTYPIVTLAVLPEFIDFEQFSSSITIKLDPSDNPANTSFTVECSTSPDYIPFQSSGTVSNPLKNEPFSVSLIGLSPETPYYIRAKAKNSEDVYTTEWKRTTRTVSTRASTPDPALTSERYSSSTNTITVEWPGSYDNSYGQDPDKKYNTETHFKILYSSSSDFNDNMFEVFHSSSIGTQRQKITGLQSNSTYYFRLSVLTRNNEPDDTESDVVDMAEFYTAPATPERVVFSTEAYTAIGFDTFTINWKHGNNSPESEYAVYLCTASTSTCTCVSTPTVRGLSYKFNNLNIGTSYYAKVKTKGIRDDSYSDFIFVSTTPVVTKTETDYEDILRDTNTIIRAPAFRKEIMLSVPAFSISSNLSVKIKPLYKANLSTYTISGIEIIKRPAVAGEKLLSGNLGLEITLSTNTANVQYTITRPMTLIMPYEDEYLTISTATYQGYSKAQLMSSSNIVHDKLILAYYNKTTGNWNPVETVSDAANHVLTAKIWNFGVYQIMQTTAMNTAEKVRIYPNPYRPSTNYGVVHFENLPDINGKGSKVKIFTIAGELVRAIEATGTSVTWDGLNKSGNKAGSGIYFVFIQSKDNPSVSKIYKLAIER